MYWFACSSADEPSRGSAPAWRSHGTPAPQDSLLLQPLIADRCSRVRQTAPGLASAVALAKTLQPGAAATLVSLTLLHIACSNFAFFSQFNRPFGPSRPAFGPYIVLLHPTQHPARKTQGQHLEAPLIAKPPWRHNRKRHRHGRQQWRRQPRCRLRRRSDRWLSQHCGWLPRCTLAGIELGT